MGDRIVIAFFENGDYRISLYDHWGGDIFKCPNLFDELQNALVRLADESNDFSNFLTMFIHWYRKWRGLKPEEPYNIYLELIPCLPDYDVICFDYATREIKIMSIEEFSKIVHEKYPNVEGTW